MDYNETEKGDKQNNLETEYGSNNERRLFGRWEVRNEWRIG